MTMTPEPTYVFENEKVYALVNGQVVASGIDVGDVEEELAAKAKNTIVTPSGVQGQILTSNVWGEKEVTVRLANGRIVTVPVSEETEFEMEASAESISPVASLQQRLEASVEGDRESLVARRNELKAIVAKVGDLVRKGVSQADEYTLDEIRVQAEYEGQEVDSVLQHLDAEDVEAFEAPAPYEMQVVEQATMGGGDGSWLDNTMQEMVDEAEATDYEQLMAEGPSLMTAEMEEAALADAGTVRQMAASFIRSKTAGVDEGIREQYEKTFLGRVESARREELKRRQAVAKEAATKEASDGDFPDEALFM